MAKKFQEGGVTDYGDIAGAIDAILSAGTGRGPNFSIDPASIHWNAAQGDSATQAIRAGIAEESTQEQMMERMQKCANEGGEWDIGQKKCVVSTATLGADATTKGKENIEATLNDLADDQAFGDLINNIYTAASTVSGHTMGLAQSTGENWDSCAAKGMEYQPWSGKCVANAQNQAAAQIIVPSSDPYDVYMDAINDLKVWNARRGDYDETNINTWLDTKKEKTEKLLAAKADFEASGGSTDPTLLDQVLGGVVTAGGTASNVLSGATGAPTFSQMVYNLPGLLDGILSGTFQYGDAGPNLPIKVGEYGDTGITATTGIPLFDKIIGGAGTVAEEGLITPTGANIPSMGEIVTSAGEVINETFDPTATLKTFADEDTKDTKDTTVGVSTEGTITGGDGTDTITSGDGTDAVGGGLDPTLVSTIENIKNTEGITDAVEGGLDPTLVSTIENIKDTEGITTAPTFSGSIDTAPKYETVTTTDYIGPSLAASLGFTTEEAETLNNVLKGSLGFDTTQTDTLNNVLKGSLGFDTTQTDTLDNVLKGSLAGETTSVYDSSPQLSATLEGNVLKTTSNAPVLEGSLGAVNKTGDVLRAALGGGGGGGGGGMGMPSASGMRRGRTDPGDLVDIDYLYDFARGLDQPFLVTDEEDELIKAAEGGMIGDGNKDDFERILRIVRGI